MSCTVKHSNFAFKFQQQRCEMKIYNSFFRGFFLNAAVKIMKMVHVCQNYHKKTAWVFLK